MSLSLNTVLIIVVALTFVIAIVFLYTKSKREKPDVIMQDKRTMSMLLEKVKHSLADLVREETFSGLNDQEWETLYKRKARIQEAMKNCVYGVDSARTIVLELIADVVRKYAPDEAAVFEMINLNSEYLDPRIKFEAIMMFYERKVGLDAFIEMIKEYDLDRERYEIEDGKEPSYMITAEDIGLIYSNEDFEWEYEDMVELVAILTYQKYKGFGHVDTILRMNINGINLGASGSILQATKGKDRAILKAPRSAWLNLWGKFIHLRFINFGNEEEMRRVIQLICRYNSPGPLTEKRGYLVNTMHDKSRVLALRPPVSEYWAVFIRKFTISNATAEKLVVKQLDRKLKYDDEYREYVKSIPGYKPSWETALKESMDLGEPTKELLNILIEERVMFKGFTGNAHIPIKLYYYLMQGEVTVAVTGRQNSGKTTAMTTFVRYIDPRYTIRVLEMAPELYLREMYPERNILSLQETQWVSAQALQDALKKSDAAVSIVGEVATDIIAARMIQMGRIASLFTIFSHHANTAKDLAYGLRDSLVSAEGMSNEAAINNVLDVVRVNAHLDFTTEGKRFHERITEIIKLAENTEYPAINPKNVALSLAKIQREHYRRLTDREKFATRDIMGYDHNTDSYYAKEWFTPELTEHMMSRMPDAKVPGFKKFIISEWSDKIA